MDGNHGYIKHSGDGHVRPAGGRRRHRQQPRQPEHHGIQAARDRIQQPSGRGSCPWRLHHPDHRQRRTGGVESGYGVELAGISRIHEQGNLKATGNSFDLAIQGQGFFQVTLPTGGTAYSRDGTFQINGDGEIVTHIGYTLAPGITVPANATDVTINTSGEVMAKVEGQINLVTVGKIQLALFANAAGLENTGDNLLVETAASGAPAVGNPGAGGFGSLAQGFLETSNVNPIQEIANLIKAQRAYELNAKVIETAEKMVSTTTTA